MAEPEKPGVKIPLPWGGEVTAFGFDVVLLIGIIILGAMLWKQSEQLNHQNILLNQQTEELKAEVHESRCILGIDIFTHQYPRGQVDWNDLPVSLYRCLPEYAKKLPPVAK